MAERDGPKHIEVEKLEDDSLLGDDDMLQQAMSQQAPRHRYLVEWLVWGILILFSLALMTDNIRLRKKQDAVAESAFKTDLTAAKPLAALVEYAFTGGIQIDENGKLYREVDPSKPQYAGEPSPEIDKAWDDLLEAVDLILPVEEVHGAEAESIHTPDGKGVFISLDVYHSLHCVDLMRRAIDFRYYYPTGKVPYFYRSHLDHCVDYVRQALQCQSDLTPLTYLKYSQRNTSIPVFGTSHTCRDFSKVHEWAIERRAEF
ncbi:hypothetical protein BP5796_02906 [Coleophoma crateriformis]|uniref:Uncharacterized protein n=1 Tax=Coleophoma crateriformis TaxID=565419 RepID=A0A3D8SZY8_9HELO|nr:hypothetical protein BP5796_02906 [Coleophoma crateriformis]